MRGNAFPKFSFRAEPPFPFRNIPSWCDQSSLPKMISDVAKWLYKRADKEKLLRGKPLDAVIAACIFIACQQAHVPRTFHEICNLTQGPRAGVQPHSWVERGTCRCHRCVGWSIS
jgi:transcription initiation factor TFIIIB Brf1 subunit/transcription initiation factor TFIIB